MPYMNLPHIHLLMNHVPTVGTVIAVGLLVLALFRRNEHLKHAALEVFFLLALATLPVYLTGVAAQLEIQGRPDVSKAAIAAHHDAALLSFILMMLTGFVAWLSLWQFRRHGRAARWTTGGVLLLAALTLATVAPAASIGGEIRHPEIMPDPQAIAPAGVWVSAAAVQDVVTTMPWVWPAAETLHFIGLSLLFGILFAVNLRLLGGLRGIPFAAMHRMLPWAMLGFGINLITGMLFFIAAPEQYTQNAPFLWKIICLMIAGADLLYLTVFDKIWALEPGDDAAGLDKAIAALAIVAWVGVIYWGRMLPFLGNAF